MKEHNSVIVNPIYYWLDEDVWKYIRQEGIKTNPLYEQGYHRVGCVGCPLATYKAVMKEFNDFPQYKENYISAFERMLKARRAAGKDDITNKKDSHRWENGEDVFNWWIEEYKHNVKGQLSLFEEDDE